MGVSKIGAPPNHPFLFGFSIINYAFLGTLILGNPHIYELTDQIIVILI